MCSPLHSRIESQNKVNVQESLNRHKENQDFNTFPTQLQVLRYFVK